MWWVVGFSTYNFSNNFEKNNCPKRPKTHINNTTLTFLALWAHFYKDAVNCNSHWAAAYHSLLLYKKTTTICIVLFYFLKNFQKIKRPNCPKYPTANAGALRSLLSKDFPAGLCQYSGHTIRHSRRRFRTPILR